MYTRQGGAAPHRTPRARILRGTASQATATENGGIPKAVCRTSRHRRHARPSHPTLRLRQCRYIGIAKVHLQHVLTAAAINLVRIADWWTSTLRATTRRSRWAALRPVLA